MGRWSTGAETCEMSQRLELTYLLKKKFLVKGEIRTGRIYWTYRGKPNGNITVYGCLKENEKYVRLVYSTKDYRDGETYEYDYKIQLTAIPSNLGKGEVLYFVCPETGKRCRVLYCAYDSHTWKAREAYNRRLYYDAQISAKMDYANNRYWALNRELEKIESQKYLKPTYKGQTTRKAQRIERMKRQRRKWELEGMQLKNVTLSLRRIIERNLRAKGIIK